MKSSVLLSVAISSAILLGCGGGSESNTNSPTTPIKDEPTAVLRGIAIDGYLTGARAFIDYNLDGQWNEHEPLVVTAKNGQFAFEQTDLVGCWRFAPLIIDVPVGAHDSDHGVVTDAYQLSAPPQFASANPASQRVVSPFTTLVWQQVEFAWLTRYPELSCEQLAEQPAKQRALQSLIAEQEQQVMTFFQLTRDQLYGDFIASGDHKLHQTANLLVQGFAEAKQQNSAFAQQHADAQKAQLTYYLGYSEGSDGAFQPARYLPADRFITGRSVDKAQQSWYRSERVIAENEASWRRYLVSDDRQHKLALHASNHRQQETFGDVLRIIDSQWRYGQSCLVAVTYQTVNPTWDGRHYAISGQLTVPFVAKQQRCDLEAVTVAHSELLAQLDNVTVQIHSNDSRGRMVSR
ncbi:hypothetical protein M3914_002456 [Vibrio metschnikovii]|nr:hypothetical protein [Vibrio metschnikovii]EKO3684252.1 hypothetical protein [Vibrio metschnikovii]EKO3874067.1 hypothetical protein [Vibrio metschnikovii]